jgi:hypothetical protein
MRTEAPLPVYPAVAPTALGHESGVARGTYPYRASIIEYAPLGEVGAGVYLRQRLGRKYMA